MKVATNGSAGVETSSVGRAELEDAALADHADPVGERRGVLEVVGDEQRRQRRARASSSRSSARTPARVCASSAESGSSSSSTAGSRASARASATRWRSPPESSLHARAREVADAEPLEEVVHPRAVAGAEAHVAEHVEVREERVLLEQVADAPPLGRDVAPRSVSSSTVSPSADQARLRAQQPGDDAQDRRLAGARRADEGERLALLDGQLG